MILHYIAIPCLILIHSPGLNLKDRYNLTKYHDHKSLHKLRKYQYYLIYWVLLPTGSEERRVVGGGGEIILVALPSSQDCENLCTKAA